MSQGFRPQVSVIIPTYNRAGYIGAAIDSVLKQTYPHFELLIVNDGSSDNTESVLNGYSDPRIKRYTHSKNRGQNAALNTGLQAATGDLIAFLDSDDTWLPRMLVEQLASFENSSAPICSYTLAAHLKNGEQVITKRFVLEGKSIYAEALRQLYISHMITLMIDRRCLEIVKGFDEAFTVCQDDDFCLRLAKHFEFKLIPRPLAIITTTQDSVISDKTKYADGWDKLCTKFEGELRRECGDLVWLYHKFRIACLYLDADQTTLAQRSLGLSGFSSLRPFLIKLGFKFLRKFFIRRYI